MLWNAAAALGGTGNIRAHMGHRVWALQRSRLCVTVAKMTKREARNWMLEQMRCCQALSEAMASVVCGHKHSLLLTSALGELTAKNVQAVLYPAKAFSTTLCFAKQCRLCRRSSKD